MNTSNFVYGFVKMYSYDTNDINIYILYKDMGKHTTTSPYFFLLNNHHKDKIQLFQEYLFIIFFGEIEKN